MIDCDLSFEYTDVQATLKGKIISIKNAGNGRIEVDEVGEIIEDDHQKPGVHCDIIIRNKK